MRVRVVWTATAGVGIRALRAIVKKRGTRRESSRLGTIGPWVQPFGNTHALREHGNTGSLVRSQQGWFLQLFRQVAAQRGVPADGSFQRQAIHLRIGGRW